MKKFLKNLLLAAAIWFIVMFLPLIVRTALWQGRAAEIFTLPPHTEVLCIGNSHTGCTWSDAPAFAFHKEWRSGRGFLFAVLRLLEFERRGQLDGVKVCLMDCDRTARVGLSEKKIRQGYSEAFPLFWRYLGRAPLSRADLLTDAALKWFRKWPKPEKKDARPSDKKAWTDRTDEERARNIAKEYAPEVWNANRPVKDVDDLLFNLACVAQEVCDRHGIRLILFAAPVVSENPERTQPEVYSRELDALIARIRAAGIEYQDLRAACPDAWFRDAHHLSSAGADAFTGEFCKKVLNR